ncbi:uncharacterized protein znf518a [Aplochiton taeniatus]
MESLGLSQDVPSGDSKRVINNRNAKWHKRLRKGSGRTPTMQGIDKHEPKITEEHKQNMQLLSLMESAQASQPFRSVSENTLRFRCLKCKDSLEFDMSGLAEHFQYAHSGSLPVFPCDMCTYSTHEFSCFQLHRLGHKDTFASCNICHDDVQRTLSELTKHLNMQHSLNGQYVCEPCDKFCTDDVGKFLEHIYQHDIALQENGIGNYSGLRNGNDLFTQLMPVTAMLPFHCTLCDFEAPQKWMITKHLATVHGEEFSRNSKRMMEVHPKTIGLVDTKPGPHRTARKAGKEMDWMSQDCLAVPGREFLYQFCSLSKPDRALEETHRFLERSSTGETVGQNWTKTLQNVLSNVPLDMSISPNERNDTDQKSTLKDALTKKSKRRQRGKVRLKTMEKSAPGLKLLLKKNPVKDKQWMSQSPFPQLGSGILEDYQRLAHPHKTLEETQRFLQSALAAKNGKKKWSKSPKTELQNISRNIIALTQSKSNTNPATGNSRGELSKDDFLMHALEENTPSCQTAPEDALPADVHHWKLSQRHVEKTLNLSPLSATQHIKRPVGDQPVVVLNHPDTETPEVSSIMEVIHRYNGDIQKVVLSRKTLHALSPAKPAGISDSANAQALSAGCVWPENVVKERFILKLKLKKRGRRKYEVVEATSHSSQLPARFRCWFCGRVFSDQETWMVHGQRHLMEWRKPKLKGPEDEVCFPTVDG